MPDVDLKGLLSVLREFGVKSYTVRRDELTVELYPVPPPAGVTDEKDLLPREAVCKCGHAPYEHSEAGCLRGCELSVCAPAMEDGNG